MLHIFADVLLIATRLDVPVYSGRSGERARPSRGWLSFAGLRF
jgi:hypothetical protein